MESALNFTDLFSKARPGSASEMSAEARSIEQSEIQREQTLIQNPRRKATVKRSFKKAMKKAASAA